MCGHVSQCMLIMVKFGMVEDVMEPLKHAKFDHDRWRVNCRILYGCYAANIHT